MIAPDDDDERRRWSRLILFTLAMILLVLGALWWTSWLNIPLFPGLGAD